MLIVLNHKMNLTLDEILKYERAIRNLDVVVMPQIPYMGIFTEGNYILGSQYISEYTATGGISAASLVSMDVKYVLIGHAERRSLDMENDLMIAKKIIDIINNKMIPIMCVGETAEERSQGESLKVIENQICNVLDVIEGKPTGLMIAYEPVWSIGTSEMPTPVEIMGMFEYIRIVCKDKYQLPVKLIYGGSINSSNVETILSVKTLDGLLIGGASLDLEEVKRIYQIVKK